MDIAKIDKNFELPKVERDDIVWINVQDAKELVFGVFYDEGAERYYRMPQEIANTVNEGVAELCRETAGGRLRFKTNSPFVALKGIVDDAPPMFHMPSTGSQGFGLYVDKLYAGTMASNINWQGSSVSIKNGERAFQSLRHVGEQEEKKEKEIEIYFPLYNGVRAVYVGVQAGSTIKRAEKYLYDKPVVFYGSSITQGGCASHPGNEYQGHLSRWLNFDYVNLGFSGNGKGESEIAEYLAGLSASVFVLDYDANAPSVEHLQKTHEPLYQTIRNKNPETPIIFITLPFKEVDYCKRRAVIYQTYQKAQQTGDKNVWFLDGMTVYGEKDRDACTVDLIHPNDLGFYRMAETIRPLLEEALKHNGKEKV